MVLVLRSRKPFLCRITNRHNRAKLRKKNHMSLNEAENMKTRTPEGWSLSEMKEEARRLDSVVVLYTSWYPEVIDSLKASALEYLESVGVSHKSVHLLPVPGSFELPLAALQAIEAKDPEMVIALGCVIKGDTPHFDFVCSAVSSGLMKVQLKKKIPLGFGVLTVNSLDQALARKDKGFEAAQAAFFMHLFSRRFEV